jgi:peptidoglycan hydrolase-like protein with peptidoglycan-binding domain
LDDLCSLYVANSSNGVRVPLSQLASFERQIITPKIRRRDHDRCITVRCDAINGVLPSEIVKQLQARLNALGCDVGAADGLPGKRTREAALSCREFPAGTMP